MDQLHIATQKIKSALLSGIRLTTAQGNRIGHTVDFRKIISRLRRNGMEIKSFWNKRDGRRYKTYYCNHPLPAKGSSINDFGTLKLDV